MFCTSCGAQMPDNAAFCTSCGNKLNSNPAQPVQEQPTVQQSAPTQPEPAPTPVQPEPDFTPAPAPNTSYKKTGRLILLTFFLSLLLIAGSIIMPVITDITDIPFISLAISISDGEEDIDQAKDGLDEAIDKADRAIEEKEDIMTTKQKKVAKSFLRETKKLNKTFSLLNLRNFADSIKDLDELEDYEEFNTDFDGLEDFIDIIDYIIIGLICAFLLPIIFSLLGGLLKSKGCTITALVFMVLSQLLLSGILWVILSFVIYITQAVLCGKYQKAKILANA